MAFLLRVSTWRLLSFPFSQRLHMHSSFVTAIERNPLPCIIAAMRVVLVPTYIAHTISTGVSSASEAKVKELIYGVGFHNNKAKYIKQSAQKILEVF